MNKSIPDLQSDDDAARFVEQADLSDYDVSGFVPTRFDFEANAAQLETPTAPPAPAA